MKPGARPIIIPISVRIKKLLASEQFLHYIDPRPTRAVAPGMYVIANIFHSPIMYGAYPMA
jgi:hypothetical protein